MGSYPSSHTAGTWPWPWPWSSSLRPLLVGLESPQIPLDHPLNPGYGFRKVRNLETDATREAGWSRGEGNGKGGGVVWKRHGVYGTGDDGTRVRYHGTDYRPTAETGSVMRNEKRETRKPKRRPLPHRFRILLVSPLSFPYPVVPYRTVPYRTRHPRQRNSANLKRSLETLSSSEE